MTWANVVKPTNCLKDGLLKQFIQTKSCTVKQEIYDTDMPLL